MVAEVREQGHDRLTAPRHKFRPCRADGARPQVRQATLDARHADIVLPWDGRNHYLAAVYRTELASVVDDLVAADERTIAALVARVDSQRLVIGDSSSLVAAKPASVDVRARALARTKAALPSVQKAKKRLAA